MRNNDSRSGNSGIVVSTLAGIAVALLLAACGGTAGESPAGSGAMTVSVAEPASGATVNAPFTVKVDASVPLGPTESGLHHVHLWFDENETEYVVVESNSTEVTTLASGAHTMHVSLRNADHSPAGADTEVSIMVSGAGGSTTGTPTSPGPGGATKSPSDY